MAKRVVRTNRSSNQDDFQVGLRIRARRKQKKMTLADLADQLGVALQQVQKYENGRNRVSMGRLSQIAEALGVSATFLLTGSEEKRGDRPADEATALLKIDGALRLIKAYDRMKNRDARHALVEMAEVLVGAG